MSFALSRKIILCLSFCFISCDQKKKQQREEQLEVMLRNFFTVRTQAAGKPDGLWIADKEAVAAMVEKKYLSNYVAKPDEIQKEEIRKRLAALTILYRIEGGSIAMLSQVADSVGVSAGGLRYSEKITGGQAFQARLRGKDGEVAAIIRYFPSNKGDRLEYVEAGYTIGASRESRAVDDLVTEYKKRLEQATELPRY